MPQVTIEDGGAMHTLMAPPVLPEMVGCISSVRHALLGAGDNPSMLSRGLVLPAAVLVGLIASVAYAVPHVQALLAPAPPPEPTLFEWLFGEWY